MKKLLKTLLPWLVCLAIFYYLFTQIPPQEIFPSLKFLSVPLFIAVAVLYFFAVHIIDCLTIKHFISRFAATITHKESWIVRGVSYLFMVINYHAAQGAFAVYFKKTHNAPIAKTLGTLLFINILDFLLIFTSALLALSYIPVGDTGFDLRKFALKLAPLIYAGYFMWIIFWKNTDSALAKKLKQLRPVRWVLEHNIFHIFREARPGDYFRLLLYRIPIIIIIMGGYNFCLMAFHAFINWEHLYLYNPIVLLITSLPITPAGLGTGQFLTIAFFKNTVTSPLFMEGITTPASLLLASNLLWFLANQILKVLFGVVCLTRTSQDLFKNQMKQTVL